MQVKVRFRGTERKAQVSINCLASGVTAQYRKGRVKLS